MLFSSMIFIFLFLPVFLVLYYIVPIRYRNSLLLLGSLIFYAYGEPVHIVLLLLSVLLNYVFGIGFSHTEMTWKRRVLLSLALLYNLGMLFFFKYQIENGALPLGISFYTFQIVSYLIDVYKRRIPAERNLLQLGTYLCMFPQLMSGPLIAYSKIKDSLYQRSYSVSAVEDGLKTFTIGLASKILIANPLGSLWRDAQIIGFDSISTPMAWIAMFAFSLQIYFDFNGYSLMAIGLGRMLGFTLPQNFDHPYAATSISDFWRRWHITLGLWFREYIYIPLGGNRKGTAIMIVNLFLVWMCTGLWHGFGTNFLLWSLFCFILIAIEKLFFSTWLKHPTLLRVLFARLYVLLMIPLSWMLFAITDLTEIKLFFSRLFPPVITFSQQFFMQPDVVKALSSYGIFFLAGIVFCLPCCSRFYEKHKNNIMILLSLLLLFWLCIHRILNEVNNPFLYFSF